MIYLYETVVMKEGDTVVSFEVEQGMQDLPLTRHPETGVAIRRVILGGWGSFGGNVGAVGKGKQDGDACDCGPAGCC